MALNKRKTILGILLVVVLLAGAWVYWFVNSHGFSAREQPTRFEAYLARHARRIATPRGARELKNPLSPTELDIAEARDHFADHCAICHANNGSGTTQINSGLYPPAPDMRERQTQDLRDGEIFYIIKNGIRFTGMPGWGGEDEENWKLVLFIRHLPSLTVREIELMNEVNGLEKKAEATKLRLPSTTRASRTGIEFAGGRLGSETVLPKCLWSLAERCTGRPGPRTGTGFLTGYRIRRQPVEEAIEERSL